MAALSAIAVASVLFNREYQREAVQDDAAAAAWGEAQKGEQRQLRLEGEAARAKAAALRCPELSVIRSQWSGDYGTVQWDVAVRNTDNFPRGNFIYLTRYSSETGVSLGNGGGTVLSRIPTAWDTVVPCGRRGGR